MIKLKKGRASAVYYGKGSAVKHVLFSEIIL